MSGYVVRWLDFSDDLLTSMDAVKRRDTLPEIMAVYNDLGCMGQALFSVSADGTETPLPTYEEALAALAELRAKGQALLPWLDHGPREMDPDECLRMNIAKHAFREAVSK